MQELADTWMELVPDRLFGFGITKALLVLLARSDLSIFYATATCVSEAAAANIIIADIFRTLPMHWAL